MRVPDELRTCVIWLGTKVEGATGTVLYNWHGTAFLIEMPFAVGTGLHRYLVTADHVLARMADDLHLAQQARLGPGQQVMRINHLDGKAAYVALDASDVTWWRHPSDAAADVAVTPFPLPVGLFDVLPLPLDMCLSDETIAELGIGVGHEVVVTGLFRDMPGNQRNLPIVRTGNIAMLPSERVFVHERGPMESYLIEARSTGGMSGSPAFVQHIYVNERTGDLDATYYLLGLVHGHWEFDVTHGATEDMPQYPSGASGGPVPEDSTSVEEGVNVGIAVVVPAKAIRETLEHPGLVAAREREEMKHARPHMPKPD